MGKTNKDSRDYGRKPDHRNSKELRKLNKALKKSNERAEQATSKGRYYND